MENSFSKIRKAIEGTAENLASKELLDKPEQRHYDAAFQFYKQIRGFQPEMIETLINLSAEGKELSDEMGPELHKIFNRVSEEKTEGDKERLNEAAQQIEENKELTKEELKEELYKLKERFLKTRIDEIKSDPRIITAFEGKEELLNKSIEFLMSFLSEMHKLSENERPQLELMTWDEFIEKLIRMRRGGLTKKEQKRKNELERMRKEDTSSFSKENTSSFYSLLNKIIKFFRSEN